MDQFSLL